MDERRLNERFNMGISRRNRARPRLRLGILWTTSNALRILGGPGRN